MKIIKKIFLVITLTTIFSVSAFARSGFEFILNVPIGASYSIISQNMKDYEIKNSFGLDAGVEAQLGYMFQIKEGFGISILEDIGYSHNNYKIKYGGWHFKDYYFRYDSIQLGLLPKFNIKRFSIGIGGGIKFPIFEYWGYTYKSNLSYASYSIENNEDEIDNWVDATYSADDIEMKHEPYHVIPYAKLTFDYSIFFANKWAVNIGLYCRYDFLPKNDYIAHEVNINNGYTEKPKNYGTLNFGVQLGLRFGPRE